MALNLPDPTGKHTTDHRALHNAYNGCVHSSEFESLQAAIDVAVGAKCPLLVAGTHVLPDTLLVSGPLRIIGLGARLDVGPANPAMLVAGSLIMDDVRFVGKQRQTTAILLRTSTRARIRGCDFESFDVAISTDPPYGAGHAAHYTKIEDCYFNANRMGLRWHCGFHTIAVRDSKFDLGTGIDGAVGVQLDYVGNSLIDGCDFAGDAATPGIIQRGIVINGSMNCGIRRCEFEGLPGNGIRIRDTTADPYYSWQTKRAEGITIDGCGCCFRTGTEHPFLDVDDCVGVVYRNSFVTDTGAAVVVAGLHATGIVIQDIINENPAVPMFAGGIIPAGLVAYRAVEL